MAVALHATAARLVAFFRPEPDAPPIADPRQIDRVYRRWRWTVILTLIFGYGFSYTCRLGLSLVKKPLIDGGIFDASELGWIGAAFLWTYAIGKLCNGFLADRVSVRRFIPVGLAVSAGINLAMGFNRVALVAVVLWAVNGWFQGFGGPGCVVSITRWFSVRERGTMYGLWSTAHSVGEFTTYVVIAALVSVTVWNAAFIGAGVVVALVAVGVFFGLRDRPETVGLPPVNVWKRDAALPRPAPQLTIAQAQLILLRTPSVWVLGLAAATMYVTRYAINNWGVLYLQEVHGYGLLEAGSLIGVNTIAGLGGCAAYGFFSDRWFGSRRPPLTLVFGVAEIASLLLIFFAPTGSTLLLTVGFTLYGFTLSGLLAVLGGLFAIDIAPRAATGAAVGLIGAFSYLGAGIQEVVSGWLVERGTRVVEGTRHYDFTQPFAFWIGASILSMLMAATLWRVSPRD